MEKIYKTPFKDLIKEYPDLDEILKKFVLECTTCDFANNFTLEELIDGKEEVKDKFKIELFRYFKK